MAKIYAIVLDDPDPELEGRLKGRYDKVFAHTDTFYLVVGGVNALTENIAIAAGIKSDPPTASGVVFRLNGSYSGYTKRTLWEWLEDVAE